MSPMSPYKLVSDSTELQRAIHVSEERRTLPSVSVILQRRDRDDVWEQFSDAVKNGAMKLGFEEPETEVRKHPLTSLGGVAAVVVAPGIAVSVSEYQERYGGMDLEALRKRMNPAVYKAFVRYIGSVRGREDLDVTVISEIPDD